MATQAALDTPQGIAVDSRGNLYIADLGNFRIRLVSLDGIIRTVAGTGGGIISPADGISATQADIGWPYGVAVDGEDNLYLGGSILQKVSADGRITPINPSLFSYDSPGYHGEDAPASAASFGGRGVAIGRDGEIYAAGSQVIWVVRRTNQLTAVNAASGRQGEIAPGEILVVYGNGIGPKQLLQATPDFDGTYPTQLAGTEIRVNGVPAPLVYTSSSQASAVVPYGTVGSAVAVTAFFQGRATAGSYPALASSAPGVFTADGSGRGQAAVLNQDGSLNSGSRPASAGDVIVLYVTGEGKTTPAGEDGRLVTGTSRPELPVSAFVGGQAARVIYAGTAPGEVAGLMQVNVQVPPGIVKGDAIPLLVQVGGVPSQPDVTVAIR